MSRRTYKLETIRATSAERVTTEEGDYVATVHYPWIIGVLTIKGMPVCDELIVNGQRFVRVGEF